MINFTIQYYWFCWWWKNKGEECADKAIPV